MGSKGEIESNEIVCIRKPIPKSNDLTVTIYVV
jgi:hypothetical protein